MSFAATATDAVDGNVAVTCDPVSGSSFDIGATTVSCSASDAAGNTSTRRFVVTVVDTTAPALSRVSVDQPTLWPAKHQMINVALFYTVSDAVTAAPICSVSVVSNEPVNGAGEGDTAPDWEVGDTRHLWLRAERAGTGSGRAYTIGVSCRDERGNTTSRDVVVGVPKSQRR